MLCLFVFAITIHQFHFMILFTLVIALLFLFGTGYSYKHIFLLLIPFLFIFLSTSSSMILFGKGEITLFKFAYVHITKESLIRGIHIGFRTLSFAMLSLTFALTTRPVKLFYSLMQQLKLSPKYAYTFMAAIRLIPIMIEEFHTIRNAQKVRGIQGQKNLFKRMKILMIPLLSQSIRRAHRIAVAMEAKKFDSSKKRTYFYEIRFSKFDIFFASYFLIMFGLAYLFSLHFPIFPVTDVRF